MIGHCEGDGLEPEGRNLGAGLGTFARPVTAMSFCSFFGGEVFQNHFEPGTACGIEAGIAFWVAVEFLSQDLASVIAVEKRAQERRTRRRGWPGHWGASGFEKRRDPSSNLCS